MKPFSIFLSIIVGIASIVLFRQGLRNIALVTTETFFNLTSAAFRRGNQTPKPHIDHQLYASDMSIPRAIRKVFLAVEQAEGAGARVRRSIGTPQLRNFSPFLMLGE